MARAGIFFVLCLVLNEGLSQLTNCDAFGGCFCSTSKDSKLYLEYIAPDIIDYRVICDPTQFKLRHVGNKIEVNADFNGLVVIPVSNSPLNFNIDGDASQFTTIRCKDSRDEDKENALVHTSSNDKKQPTTVSALVSNPNLDYQVFVLRYNDTLSSWTQLPRALCRHDARTPELACLPVDCNSCAFEEAISECEKLKAENWP